MRTSEPTSLVVPPPADKKPTGVSRVAQPAGNRHFSGHLGRVWRGGSLGQQPPGTPGHWQGSLGRAADVLLAVALFVIIGMPGAAAQHPNGQGAASGPAAAVAPALVAKLTAPFHSAITAKPLRETLTQIATIAELNLWLDRRVNPSLPVNLPGGSQSVYQALARGAESLDLRVAVVGNVVLVGRPEWVHTLAGAVLALPAELREDDAWPPISWPDATTPDEALQLAASSGERDTRLLPHDLWPAVNWRGVSPQLAVLLITAQFDLMPADPQPHLWSSWDSHQIERGQENPAAGPRGVLFSREPSFVSPGASDAQPTRRPRRSFEWQPLQAPSSLTLVYPNGPYVPQLKQAVQAADSSSRFRTGRSGGPLELTGSPGAHLAAIAVYVSQVSVAPAVELDSTRFSLRLRDAPAEDVFAQLAATARRQLQIAPAAAAACRQRVTLEGVNVTLAELTARIAKQIGVQPTWTEQTLLIEPQP